MFPPGRSPGPLDRGGTAGPPPIHVQLFGAKLGQQAMPLPMAGNLSGATRVYEWSPAVTRTRREPWSTATPQDVVARCPEQFAVRRGRCAGRRRQTTGAGPECASTRATILTSATKKRGPQREVLQRLPAPCLVLGRHPQRYRRGLGGGIHQAIQTPILGGWPDSPDRACGRNAPAGRTLPSAARGPHPLL